MDQRNVILAFALSLVILLGWGMMFPNPEQPVQQVEAPSQTAPEIAQQAGDEVTLSEARVAGEEVVLDAAKKVTAVDVQNIKSGVITFANDVLKLEVNDQGWIVGSSLANYKKDLEKHEPFAVLEVEEGHELFLSSGIRGEKDVPPFKVLSNVSSAQGAELTLQTELSGGRVWTRKLTMAPGSYQIDVEDRIKNGAGAKMYRQVIERNPDRSTSTFYEFTGPIGFIKGELQEMDFDDLDEEELKDFGVAVGGWTGITSRYFIAAIYGDQERDYRYYYTGDGKSYRAGLHDDGITENGDALFRYNIYIGPKSIEIMKKAGVELEKSVNFGWFTVLSKPMHDALLWLYKYVPNFGICIVILVIGLKILFFYPTQKSYQSMGAMRKLQPEQVRLRERYGDDRQKLGQEVMALYKKHKVNPLGGCLPILIQIPVFFALYKVLLMSIEMRHAPFLGWITDLSTQDPYFILPVLMGISMYIQQQMNPKPPDPMQAKIISYLPPVFTIMFLFFPAGLVLYWVVNNALAIVQQRMVLKKMGIE